MDKIITSEIRNISQPVLTERKKEKQREWHSLSYNYNPPPKKKKTRTLDAKSLPHSKKKKNLFPCVESDMIYSTSVRLNF